MKAVSLSELKKALKEVPSTLLTEHIIRLAKFKKDNKELLTYLLYEAENEAFFIKTIQEEIDAQFEVLNTNNSYYTKKGLRKTLRYISKNSSFSNHKTTGIELLLYFCKKVNESSTIMYFLTSTSVLTSLYLNQQKKIRKSLLMLHEDLQYDYQKQLDTLEDSTLGR